MGIKSAVYYIIIFMMSLSRVLFFKREVVSIEF